MQDSDQTSDTSADSDPQIASELAALRRELEVFNSHRFIKVQNSRWRLLSQRFVMGLFTGLGTVIGATVLVSAVVVWLQNIEWVPLVGEWASQIAHQIEINLDDKVPGPADAPVAPETSGDQ